MTRTGGKRRWAAGAAAVAAAIGLAGAGAVVPVGADEANQGNRATAALIDATGKNVGRVTFNELGDGVVRVAASVTGLTGFHGFHIHAGRTCRDSSGMPNFALAAGHLGEIGETVSETHE